MKKNLIRWLPLLVIVILIGGAWTSGLMEQLSLESLKAQRGQLLDLVAAHPVLSVTAFMGLYITAVALSLPVATVLTLLGGFLFGRWLGTAIIVLGATAGASLLFLIARSTFGQSLREKAVALQPHGSKIITRVSACAIPLICMKSF